MYRIKGGMPYWKTNSLKKQKKYCFALPSKRKASVILTPRGRPLLKKRCKTIDWFVRTI